MMKYYERWSRCSASSVAVRASTYGSVRPFSNGGGKLEGGAQRRRADESMLVGLRMILLSVYSPSTSAARLIGRDRRHDCRDRTPIAPVGTRRDGRIAESPPVSPSLCTAELVPVP